MIKLYNKATGILIGEVSETALQFLIDELEEESLDDVDYYLNEATVDMLEADGADASLIKLLRRALDEHGEVDVLWSRR